MKIEMQKSEIKEIFWDCRVWCCEWVWKIFVWKMDQKSCGYGEMVDWKIPGFEPEGKYTMLCWIRTQKCFPVLNWTYSEELRNLHLGEMHWTIFQDPAPPYTEFGTNLWNSGVLIFFKNFLAGEREEKRLQRWGWYTPSSSPFPHSHNWSNFLAWEEREREEKNASAVKMGYLLLGYIYCVDD